MLSQASRTSYADVIGVNAEQLQKESRRAHSHFFFGFNTILRRVCLRSESDGNEPGSCKSYYSLWNCEMGLLRAGTESFRLMRASGLYLYLYCFSVKWSRMSGEYVGLSVFKQDIIDFWYVWRFEAPKFLSESKYSGIFCIYFPNIAKVSKNTQNAFPSNLSQARLLYTSESHSKLVVFSWIFG